VSDVARVASDVELHVKMHDACDGRLKPLFLQINYTDVRRNSSLQVSQSLCGSIRSHLLCAVCTALAPQP